MRLIQYFSKEGNRLVGLVNDDGLSINVLRDTSSVYELALEAYIKGIKLEKLVNNLLSNKEDDYEQIINERRLLPPLDHVDPAHHHVTGTGLTHLGSAKTRDDMHEVSDEEEAKVTDSMRMFQWGLKGGKPPRGQIGVQPEWFYKGNGNYVVPPEQPLELPPYALDGGEEAELVGLYVIGDHGEVLRVGFALGNEYSDHVMERQNYLYLAHSKLRTCSYGPELLVGSLPEKISGRVRILRDGKELWADTFLTGEHNMSHSLANLEYHHFKYPAFRQPGDVHCHFFGTATLSFSANIRAQDGDVFEISEPLFGRPLRNPLTKVGDVENMVTIKQL